MKHGPIYIPRFAYVIKHEREKRGMTQEQLATLLGTTQQTVNNYEQGRRKVDGEMIGILCGIFNLTPIDFYTEEEDFYDYDF